MERRRGHILRDRIPPGLAISPEEVSRLFIECLARLHSISLVPNGLDGLGRPEGFVARQVTGWTERWHRAKTSEVSEVTGLTEWLVDQMPVSGEPAIVHNDFKLDNMMFADGRVNAVLDWEMAAVGDPLADLGLAIAYWCWVNRPSVRTAGIPALTLERGWFTREQLLEAYRQLTGRDLRHIGYYEVLGVFKLAVIVQQIYLRYHEGQTNDARFLDFGERAAGLIRLAATLADARR